MSSASDILVTRNAGTQDHYYDVIMSWCPGRLVSLSPVSGAPGPGSELSARAAWLRPVARQPRLARPGRAEAGGRGQVTS